jgi:hypothetical protein
MEAIKLLTHKENSSILPCLNQHCDTENFLL